MKKLYSKYFYGNEASAYAQEHGYLDYATFAKAFDAVMNNDILTNTWDCFGEWEQENGFVNNDDEIEELENKISELSDEVFRLEEEENVNEEHPEYEYYLDILSKLSMLEEEKEELENQCEPEIYQYFIVSDQGAELIKEYTDDPLFYNYKLDMYVWGITHFGTSWDYVLTDIKLNCGDEAFKNI